MISATAKISTAFITRFHRMNNIVRPAITEALIVIPASGVRRQGFQP
jgi:hypothetical protein